jgi:hypothetical protein
LVKRGARWEAFPERWMKQAGEAGGAGRSSRQCTLAIRRHMVVCPSEPQRQSRLSVGRLSTAPGSPTSGLPGVGQFGQGRRAAGWDGGWEFLLLKVPLPWLLRCGHNTHV